MKLKKEYASCLNKMVIVLLFLCFINTISHALGFS
jgi:hypothetical protein